MNGTLEELKMRVNPWQVPPEQEYRAYILGLDGRIELRTGLMCKDEIEAKRRARCLADGYDVELWRQDQKIAEFKSE